MKTLDEHIADGYTANVERMLLSGRVEATPSGNYEPAPFVQPEKNVIPEPIKAGRGGNITLSAHSYPDFQPGKGGEPVKRTLTQFVATLSPAMQEIFRAAERVWLTYADYDTLSAEFQLACLILNVFSSEHRRYES